MRRREFITLLGGAAAWPLAARAQQPALPVIGFLVPTSPDTNPHRHLRGLRQGLKEAGFVEGENVVIEYRSVGNQLDQLPSQVDDLVRRRVAVLVVTGTNATLAAKAVAPTLQIVFIIGVDPVEGGLVDSLARPGGNLTGINVFSGELVAKRLELLHELVPAAVRVAVLVNPANAAMTELTLRDVQSAARARDLQIQVLRANSGREIDAVFTTFERERPDALFVGPGPFFTERRVHLALLTARYAVPATYGIRDIAEAGGLMSYGTNLTETYRQVGLYAARILRGARSADLPVVQPTKFELVINLLAARAIGLTVPPTLLARADEVIE